MMSQFVKWFNEVGLDCLREVGGKGAHLGELTRLGFRVPEGFCVLADAYDRFFEANNLENAIKDILHPIDLSDLPGLEKRTGLFQESFLQVSIPEDVDAEIREAYQFLSRNTGESSLEVAVRSSVAAKNLERSSFPGQMDTYHNICGEDQVLIFVKKCWASLWNFSALVYRLSLNMDPFGVFIAPVVQRMVHSEKAGVLFTANPLNNDTGETVINACLGLGEGVVSGRYAVDHFVIEKDPLTLLEQKIGNKEKKIVHRSDAGQGTALIRVDPEEANAPCLSWEELQELVTIGQKVEGHFNGPQDIEWAYADNKFYLLQTRSVKKAEV